MTWLGWLRRTRRERYELVADGDTLEDVHKTLLAVANRRRVTDSQCRLITHGGAVQRHGKVSPAKGDGHGRE